MFSRKCFALGVLLGIAELGFAAPGLESSYQLYFGGIKKEARDSTDENIKFIYSKHGFLHIIEQKNGEKTEIVREFYANGVLKQEVLAGQTVKYLENGFSESTLGAKPLLTVHEEIKTLIRGLEGRATDRLLPAEMTKPSFDPEHFIEGEFAFFSEGTSPTVLMKANYDSGVIVGRLVSLFPSGHREFEGEFTNGMLSGAYTRYKDVKGETSLREKGTYNSGILDGPVTLYFDKDKVFAEISVKMGIIDGPVKKFHLNGSVEESCQFQAGARVGSCKVFSAEGKTIVSGNYDGGKRQGLWEEWYTNGQPKRVANYQSGKLNGEILSYHQNGKIAKKESYKNNLLDGPSSHYDPNGSIKGSAEYKANVKSGSMKIYYPNGRVEMEANFKDGRKDGLQKKFYDTGEIAEETNYSEGRQVGFSQSYYKSGVKMGGSGAMDGIGSTRR
jgi:antitoxin component YwqK of YwqJK toxin-antitoxin module